jgi:hypothetical protein
VVAKRPNATDSFDQTQGRSGMSTPKLRNLYVSQSSQSLSQGKINCQVGAMPFTYLGLPLGTTRPSVDEYMPLLNRIEKRMMGIISVLTYVGRLIMVNSVLSALTTFYLWTLKVPVSILHQIDKYRKNCL